MVCRASSSRRPRRSMDSPDGRPRRTSGSGVSGNDTTHSRRSVETTANWASYVRASFASSRWTVIRIRRGSSERKFFPSIEEETELFGRRKVEFNPVIVGTCSHRPFSRQIIRNRHRPAVLTLRTDVSHEYPEYRLAVFTEIERGIWHVTRTLRTHAITNRCPTVSRPDPRTAAATNP